MKRWAVLTVLLYAVTLIILTVPVIAAAFSNWGQNPRNDLQGIFQIYFAWGYWLWLAIVVAGQALLLLLPLNIAERRLPARRPLKVPVIVGAFLLANLLLAGVFCVLCVLFRDNAFYAFSFVDLLCGHVSGQPPTLQTTGWGGFASVVIVVAICWVIWAMIFRRFARSDDPASLLRRIVGWLLRGSILELLIAVPSHVIVRRRGDCCAPAGTFWGIATGISIMLLCFGPGVFYLFVERFRKLSPKPPDANQPSRAGIR